MRHRTLLYCILAGNLLVVACDFQDPASDRKILGGRPVKAESLGPERVSTVRIISNEGYCSGTIIAKDLILTASHCVSKTRTDGSVLFGLSRSDENYELFDIDNTIQHPDYAGATISSKHDVALIKLSEDIPSQYKSIKLLNTSIKMSPGETVRLAGFGKSETGSGVLNTVESHFFAYQTDGTFLIQDGQTAACNGDSGGPLFVVKNGEWYTAGVTSTASIDNEQQCIGGNIYASIESNYDQIISMAKQLTGRDDPLSSTNQAESSPVNKAPKLESYGRSPSTSINDGLQVTSKLNNLGSKLTLSVKNTTSNDVRDCKLSLMLYRESYGKINSYEITKDLAQLVRQAQIDIEFSDYAESAKYQLGPLTNFKFSSTCNNNVGKANAPQPNPTDYSREQLDCSAYEATIVNACKAPGESVKDLPLELQACWDQIVRDHSLTCQN